MVEIFIVGAFEAAMENKFNKDILVLKSGDVALFNITSHGGELECLKRMTAKVYALKEMGVHVVTYVPTYAESAGFFFFLLGDHREMEETATVHYHTPRVFLENGFIATKHSLTGLLTDISAYQDFTSSLFKASCDISEDIFALLENSELPMNRANLQTLGIINQT